MGADDHDARFAEMLDRLLARRANERATWRGPGGAMLRAIELYGTVVAPAVRKALT